MILQHGIVLASCPTPGYVGTPRKEVVGAQETQAASGELPHRPVPSCIASLLLRARVTLLQGPSVTLEDGFYGGHAVGFASVPVLQWKSVTWPSCK